MFKIPLKKSSEIVVKKQSKEFFPTFKLFKLFLHSPKTPFCIPCCLNHSWNIHRPKSSYKIKHFLVLFSLRNVHVCFIKYLSGYGLFLILFGLTHIDLRILRFSRLYSRQTNSEDSWLIYCFSKSGNLCF